MNEFLADRCPCGNPKPLKDCCGPLLKGQAQAETPEQLMRSRYTAFYLDDAAYYVATTHASTRAEADPRSFSAWTKMVEWKGLQVKATSKVAKEQGRVEFVAWYTENGKLACIAECSDFKRENGSWFYVSGKSLPRPSIGRNEACVCGSGKKYKRCCGKDLNLKTMVRWSPSKHD